MAGRTRTLIEADDLKPGIPIKRSTIIGILVLGLAVVVVSAIAFAPSTDSSALKPTAEKKSETVDPPTGNPALIDEESRDVKKTLEIEGRRAAATKKPDAAASDAGANPIPDNVRRPDSNSALAEKALQSVGTGGQAATAKGRAGMTDVELDNEVQGRMAKAVAFDDDGGSKERSSAQPGFGIPDVFRTADSGVQSNSAGGVSKMMLPGLEGLSKVQAPSAGLSMNAAQIAALAGGQGGAQGGNGGKNDKGWLDEFGSSTKSSNKALVSYKTSSRYTLHQGKIIPAVLGKEINSDLPGSITAFTTVDIYDSLGNGDLLMPKGSALNGQYSSGIKMGQRRVLFAFNRVIMPNGVSFDLPAAQGSDLAGASGIAGDVDNHFFEMFATSFFIAWTADKVAQPSNVNVYGGQAPKNPAGEVLVDVSRAVLDRQKSIPATITVKQGERINVEVKQDMEFTGPYRSKKR